jgi:hypothetical protein
MLNIWAIVGNIYLSLPFSQLQCANYVNLTSMLINGHTYYPLVKIQ